MTLPEPIVSSRRDLAESIAAAARAVGVSFPPLYAPKVPWVGARAIAFGRLEVEVVSVLDRRPDGRVPVLCRRADSGAECLPFADELEVIP
jgi:hypothetical protein